MPKAPIQTIIDTSQDAALSVYATNNQTVPAIAAANVTITNTTQYITEIINVKGVAGGNVGELEFNDGSGLAGDTGLTYDADTDSLTVSGNVFAGNIRTDNLKYANGTAYNFSGSTYSNSNVSSYLATHVGNVTAGNIAVSGIANATTFNGSGAGLTNLAAGNIVGTVANATYATTAGSANSVAGANVTGTVANATHATTASVANSVSGSNVSGTVSSATNATTATTVTANAQPNITSTGTLTGLTVSGNVSVGNISTTGNANVAHFNVSTTANLGAIGNVTITGGTSGQYLQTDGSGHLTWSTVASGSTPNLYQVTNQNGTTNVAVHITNTTDSTNYATGALTVTGGVGIEGNVHIKEHITAYQTVYAGEFADISSWNVPKFIGKDAGATYIQGALINSDANGSADWVAYGDSSDDTQGWADFGYTSTTFNDPAYTITKPGDGYFIVQGLINGPTGPQGGNLVIATGGKGSNSDIVFAVGDFTADKEYARMDDDSNTFYVGGHAYGPTSGNPTPRVVNLNVNGNVTIGGHTTVSGNIIPTANVTYDLGNATHRFRDLYLKGTTIDLGGTLIQASANGEVSIGNATFSSSGAITMDIKNISANSVASASDAGSMVVYSPVSPDLITYQLPNIATAGFTVGSRIELFVDSMSTLQVGPGSGSGVAIFASKGLDATWVSQYTWSIANTQVAKLTMFASDKWILSA